MLRGILWTYFIGLSIFASNLGLFAAGASCSGADAVSKDITFGYWSGTKTDQHKTDALTAINSLKSYLTKSPNRESFKVKKGTVIGYMWVGSMVQNSGFSTGDAMSVIYNEVKKNGIPNMLYIEYVDSDPMKTFGIVLNTDTSKLSDVQRATKKWSQGKSYNTKTGSKVYSKKTVCYLSYANKKPIQADSEAGDCYTAAMVSGKSVESVCGVNSESVQGYNPSLNFNALAVGQTICCSIGNAPDKRPSKNSDGSCYSYTIKSGDTCSSILAKYSPLSTSDLTTYNTKTYGWKGCNLLQIGQKICLSSGTAPRPNSVADAQCGPLAPGDLYMAECPLNACCSENGYCGTTSDFCDKTESSTGAPGSDGCYSNCGYGSLHQSQAKDFRKIVYWMDNEDALYKDPTKLSTTDYDTVHYGFININSDLTIDESKISGSPFLSISQKKVASFGGWTFSTSSSTYQIFRNIAATASSRQAFADKLKTFVNKYGLDGIDIDWEYPGETDIEGIPADGLDSGEKYLDLVKRIKSTLPSGKTVSVAIPATYWYLKGFPVKDMQDYVTYFVLMAYDYHGVWESKSATTGTIECHSDFTEIQQSLILLDKAKVKMWKLAGGVSTYGRTFKASSTSCTSSGCSYSGAGNSRSSTNTKGILADFEINAISKSSAKVKRWTDSTSNCDFMVYDTNSVVAWNKQSQRDTLKAFYKQYALGGTVTWSANYLA